MRDLPIGYLVNKLPFLAVYWLLAATALALVQGERRLRRRLPGP